VTELGEDTLKPYFEYPLYDTNQDYPLTAFFKLSNKRLCCIIKSRILVRDINEETDTDVALRLKAKELDEL
jgi:hypothetical protein